MKTECWEALLTSTERLTMALAAVVLMSPLAILAALVAAIWMLCGGDAQAMRLSVALLKAGALMFLAGVSGTFFMVWFHDWVLKKFIASWTRAVGEPPVVEYV